MGPGLDLDLENFTSYHMKCINIFKWTALACSVIGKNGSEGYMIKPSPIINQLLFFVYFVNTTVKLIFLSLLVTGHFGEIEFLDKICGLDYLFCGGMVCIAYIIWQRYPLYEIIYRLWEVENRIFRRLGCPREMKWRAEEQHSVTIWAEWAHVLLMGLGCCSLTIQFYMAPKYCVFTYSLIEADTTYLRLVFCFHEAIFLSHAWFSMGCSNGLCSFEAVNLSLILKKMGETVDQFAKVKQNGFIHQNGVAEGEGKTEIFKPQQYSPSGPRSELNSGQVLHEKRPSRYGGRKQREVLRLSANYDFETILYDYQQLMLISEVFNAYIGYKIVGLSICAFCQYISSTCMAFQILRMPGTGISDIWFYIQDCMVAIYVTFRVFDFMSIVLPASQGFMESVRTYMGAQKVVGGHIRKFQRTLKPVSLKLGPNPLRREAVLETMQMLVGYYLCVALW